MPRFNQHKTHMNNKILTCLILVFSISTARAMDRQSYEYQMQSQQPQGVYLVDVIIYRPLGLIATLVGSAVFVGISPLTALAAISRPHDAFEKTAQLLIVNPANYTFDRPLGVYYADPDGKYRRH